MTIFKISLLKLKKLNKPTNTRTVQILKLVQRPVLAWKTGTSYGFRDALAIGVGPRYLIGVWIGRPDGTPVPGQFGLASAAPLMLQVHDVLSNRDSQRGIVAPG